MTSKRFEAVNDYKGLEEAVQAIFEDSDDDANYDLAIIPPPPSVVTDEEEGAEEDMVTVSLPRDVPGNIEVFINNIQTSDDSSDEEPLAAKRLRRDQQERIPTWRKCSPIYSSTPGGTSEVDQRKETVKEALKDLNPVQIFEKIFDEEVLEGCI